MITTVIFDLDDTLHDEVEYCKSGFRTVADFLAGSSNVPAQDIFNTLWNQFKAGNRKNTFNKTLDEIGIDYDDNLIQELINVYRNHAPEIILPADSRKILCKLNEKYTLALLTDGFLPAQQLKVQSLGIEKYFKCIIYTEQLGREFWKPSPVGFEKIMQICNANSENIACVADNEKKDFIAPNRLGFKTIQIIRPARIHTSINRQSDAAAQHIIHQISELPELLESF
jgi:putative hydrolase of the HAD superfamily